MNSVIISKNKKIAYELKQTKRKTLAIKILLDGTVQVTAPLRMSKHEIQAMLEDKSDWIIEKLAYIQIKYKDISKEQSILKNSVLYLGELYKVSIIMEPQFTKCGIDIFGDKIYIMTDLLDEQHLKACLENWYREQTKKIIKNRMEYAHKFIHEQERTVRIRTQKSRWGSCSSKGGLNFNWRLSMAPLTVIDYVVIHEMCHLRHMNHSKEFWNMVQAILPDYKKEQQWLKEKSLMIGESIDALILDDLIGEMNGD